MIGGDPPLKRLDTKCRNDFALRLDMMLTIAKDRDLFVV